MSSRKIFTIYIFIMAFMINVGIGSTYLIIDGNNISENVDNVPFLPKISTSHSKIIINGDSELDAFCAGNGTDGTSWETAHVIENYEISSASGNGIYITHTTRFLIIQDCIVNQSSSSGISLYNCTNINIQNCIIDLSGKIGIYLHNCTKINIENCISQSTTLQGILIKESEGILINDTDILNNKAEGIQLENTNSSKIISSNISHNGKDGVSASLNCHNIQFSENFILNNSNGLYMRGGDFGGNYNFIFNNTFLNNTGNGIIFDIKNQHNIVENNEISNNGLSGINMTDHQHNNTIISNMILNNTNSGILLEGTSENSTISRNFIKDNGDNGILVGLYCDNNTIKYNLCSGSSSGILLTNNENNSIYGNNFSFNDGYGIESLGYKKASIFGNNISFNQYGVNLDIKTHYNQIWVNYISNNSDYQGSNSASSNDWDNGTVGNYWGDYEDRYPGASAIGNIWDTNYTLSGSINSNDTKPLVNIDPMLDLVPSDNLMYTLGETGHSISWTITDTYYWNPEYYIYLDDVLVKTGEWDSGDSISLNVDGLDIGTHLFKIIANDGTAWGQNQNTIEVKVGIIPESPVFITTGQTVNSSNITIQWNAVNYADSYNIYVNETLIGNSATTNYFLLFNSSGEYVIKLSAQNEFGQSDLSSSIIIVVEEPEPEGSKNNLFWYFFAGGLVLVATFIGVAFVKVKMKR